MTLRIILNYFFWVDLFIPIPILETPGTSGYVKFLLAVLSPM